MPTPITWRNVQINDGSSSAGLGNTAANFGRSATQGLSILNDQLQQRSDTEDERLTNEAISAALNGGPQVSGNRRVDAQALQKSVQSKGLFDEAIETSDLTQTGLGLSNELDTFRNENKEEVFNLEKRLTEAGIKKEESDTALSDYKLGVEKFALARTRKLAALDDAQRANTSSLDQFAQSYEDQITQEILQQQGITNPTVEDMNRVSVEAKGRAQGPEGRRAARQEMVRLGASEAAWDSSSWGEIDDRETAIADTVTASRVIARDKDIERRGLFNVNMDEGNYSHAVSDGAGNLGPASKEVIDAQTKVIGTPTKALEHLSDKGVFIEKILDDDDDKALIERVRAKFPTSSLFVPVVKGFVDAKGNLDRDSLTEALREGGRDILLSRANLKIPGGGGGTATSGGGGGREPGLRSPQEVVRAANTPEAAEEDLQQLAKDVQGSMNSRLKKILNLETDDPQVQALADQFAGIFSDGKDPGRDPGPQSFFNGRQIGASDEVLGTVAMQEKFEDFDNWFQHVKPNEEATAEDRTDRLLKSILEK